MKLVRKGGCVAVDNTLCEFGKTKKACYLLLFLNINMFLFKGSGRPVDESWQDRDTLAIRAINEKIAQDERVDFSLLPIADGLTLCLKK